MDDQDRSLAIGLAAGRIAIGAGILFTPGLATRLMGFGGAGTATLTLARIAGIRDLALGAEGLLAARSGDADRNARILRAGAICDSADAIAFGAALRAGERHAGIVGTAAATAAAALGAYLSARA